jgi:SAM-dependent methyltransferase
MRDNKKLIGFWSRQHKAHLSRPLYGYITDEYYFNKYLQHVKNKKVLDVGCGIAEVKVLFDKWGCDYWGTDLVPETIGRLKANNVNATLGDARDIPFEDNSFDFVFSFGVIEHFDETEKSIEEHIRVTKHGGDILITVPNRITPYALIESAWHIFNGTYKNGIASNGKRYTTSEMRRMVRKHDVEVINCFYYYIGALLQGASIKGFENRVLKLEKFLDRFPAVKMLFSQMIWLHLTKK